MTELILATDMSQHFEGVSRFRLRRQSPDFNIFANLEDWWYEVMEIADIQGTNDRRFMCCIYESSSSDRKIYSKP